jgi:hypothetical protein
LSKNGQPCTVLYKRKSIVLDLEKGNSTTLGLDKNSNLTILIPSSLIQDIHRTQ